MEFTHVLDFIFFFFLNLTVVCAVSFVSKSAISIEMLT